MKKKGARSYLKLRICLLAGFFAVFFAAIGFRAFQLQVLEGGELKRLAQRQHKKTVNIQPRRGDIYDRNLKELAVSVEVDSIYAKPVKVDSPRAAAKVLAPMLSMERMELERKLKSQTNFIWLKRQVDLTGQERKALAELEGIGIMKESRRYYPNRQLASNLMGFTGLDSNGLEGVELHYDGMLKGSSRRITGDKDAKGRLILFEDLDKTLPVQGMTVELTIDKTIQYIVEKSLKKTVEGSGARAGTILVMDPRTGEVLAMASYPTFDPNNISNFTPRQFRNRAVTDAFEPGSVFKLFLISAAIEENVIRPQDMVFCENGVYRVADRTFHDVKSHGWLTVPQVIKYSSNIGSAKIGEKLGRAQLHRYLKAYGFGSKTGIDLPGESQGSLRPVKHWSSVTLETISFGQGISTTGIQLTTALSAIANGGFMMKPYIVRSIKDPSGKVVSETNPAIVRRIISESTAKKMTEMLIGVTLPGGTGVKAAIDGFEVAGKTGTAQKADMKKGGYLQGAFTSSFFGFVPARNPRLAILVSIDEPKGEYHGGTVAAPAFREIAQESLSYMGVFPEGAETAPAGARVQQVNYTPASPKPAEKDGLSGEGDKPMAVPDFTGKTVRSVLRIAKTRSFDVDIVGTGRAVWQRPQAGHNIPESGPVLVKFQ